MLVEDDNDARLTMEQLLELDGHDVTAAVDGYDGLEKVRSVHPDYALIDLSMPGISGLEVASRLQSESPDLLTDDQADRVDRSRTTARHSKNQDAGFAGHMVKPVDVGELNKLMNELAVK